MKVHPKLVRRAKSVRKSMIGKYADYYPEGVTANHDLAIGSTVEIIEYEIKNGTKLTLVTVEDYKDAEHTVLFSDLAFIRKP